MRGRPQPAGLGRPRIAGLAGVAACLLAACGEGSPPETGAPEGARSARDSAAPGTVVRDGGVPQPQTSALVVPGGAFGPVAPDASANDLLAAVGPRDMALATVDVGEGTCAAGARIYPGTPDQIDIAFTDSTRSLVAFARAHREGDRWRTAEGIGIGTTLSELADLNGAPITFMGCCWDRGGVVVGYGEGALSHYGGVGFFLLFEWEPYPTEPALVGDRHVSSDNPLLAEYSLRVARIESQWRNPGDTFGCELGPDGELLPRRPAS